MAGLTREEWYISEWQKTYRKLIGNSTSPTIEANRITNELQAELIRSGEVPWDED